MQEYLDEPNGVSTDILRIHEYHHATLKFIYGQPVIRRDTSLQCGICGHTANSTILGYYICSFCRRDCNTIYKYGDVTALTTRSQSPQPGHLVLLREQARNAIAVIIQYTSLVFKHPSNRRCSGCLSPICSVYQNEYTSLSLCAYCYQDIETRASTMRYRNLLVYAHVHENLHNDVARHFLGIYLVARCNTHIDI